MNWDVSEKCDFLLGARAFYMSCAESLIKSLPLENKLLQNMKCLHPLFRLEQSSINCIKYLLAAVPSVISPSNVSNVVDEWIVYQSSSLDIPSRTERIDVYWARIFEETDLSGNLRYKYLPILIKALLVLAHGNADCERGFSINKNLLTSRHSLCVASINGLRKIKSEVKKCGGIKNFSMTPQLLSSVKKSWKQYETRIKTEENVKQNKEEKRNIDNRLNDLQEEEKILKKRLECAQIMLKKAETIINEGLKKKSFADIECGNVLLKESREKISQTTMLLEDNKKEQIKFECTSEKKMKIN